MCAAGGCPATWPDRPPIEGLSLDEAQIAHRHRGPTLGRGATTLINLLMRFYDVNGGSIKVSGTDIRDVTRAIARSYGMVLQDTWLRAVRCGRTSPTASRTPPLDEVVAAAKAAHADSFLHPPPAGRLRHRHRGGRRQHQSGPEAAVHRPRDALPAAHADPDEATSQTIARTEVRIQKAALPA